MTGPLCVCVCVCIDLRDNRMYVRVHVGSACVRAYDGDVMGHLNTTQITTGRFEG